MLAAVPTGDNLDWANNSGSPCFSPLLSSLSFSFFSPSSLLPPSPLFFSTPLPPSLPPQFMRHAPISMRINLLVHLLFQLLFLVFFCSLLVRPLMMWCRTELDQCKCWAQSLGGTVLNALLKDFFFPTSQQIGISVFKCFSRP